LPPQQGFGIEFKRSKNVRKFALEHFLADVWLRAFAAVASAVVVDEAPFLDLACESTTAMPTFNQA
jgi:hypothetical protein